MTSKSTSQKKTINTEYGKFIVNEQLGDRMSIEEFYRQYELLWAGMKRPPIVVSTIMDNDGKIASKVEMVTPNGEPLIVVVAKDELPEDMLSMALKAIEEEVAQNMKGN